MTNWQNVLRNIWDSNGKSWSFLPVFILLFIISLPYCAVVVIRNFLYDRGVLQSKKLPCRVISIGNITAGGTGKTPTVMMLAGMLKNEGYKPAVLSRGYGRKKSSDVLIVSDGRSILTGHNTAGDEPFLIAGMLPHIPVIVGSNRYLAGKIAIEECGANILILDDGFQHRRLSRDIDIVLLNTVSPVGNGCILPCGPLREPVMVLKRADIILLTGNDSEEHRRLEPPLDVYLSDFPNLFYSYRKSLMVISGNKDCLPLDWLKGKKIYAFAGIGMPLSFRRTIERMGVSLAGFSSFPDHHIFMAKDIVAIKTEAERLQAEIILTTEKDGVRLRDFPDFLEGIYFLRIEMTIIDRGNAFLSLIQQKLTAGTF